MESHFRRLRCEDFWDIEILVSLSGGDTHEDEGEWVKVWITILAIVVYRKKCLGRRDKGGSWTMLLVVSSFVRVSESVGQHCSTAFLYPASIIFFVEEQGRLNNEV